MHTLMDVSQTTFFNVLVGQFLSHWLDTQLVLYKLSFIFKIKIVSILCSIKWNVSQSLSILYQYIVLDLWSY